MSPPILSLHPHTFPEGRVYLKQHSSEYLTFSRLFRENFPLACEVAALHLVAWAEGGPYSWHDLRQYDFSEGEGGKRYDFKGELWTQNPRTNRMSLKHVVDPVLFAWGMQRMLSAPVVGLRETVREKLVGKWVLGLNAAPGTSPLDLPDMDLNDVDDVLQTAVMSEVVYA